VTQDPALAFWLRFVTREGGLVEEGRDTTLVLLPPGLPGADGLSGEIVVTTDPDVAREDGALLLAPGHPALNAAAEAVLARGDAGHTWLARPPGPPATRDELQAAARDRFPVDHGRVDAIAEPRRGLVRVLRVGVLVTYVLALHQRFQEREECWVEAETGVELAPEVWRALESAPTSSPSAPGLATPSAERAGGVRAAHQVLADRAKARLASFAVGGRQDMEAESARANAYYDHLLDSLERRQHSAPADKQALIGARIGATRQERARRLAEVEEKYRPHHLMRPFRVHELRVPADVLPVDVRRGDRRYRVHLTWLPNARRFVDVRCPTCAGAAYLVAGKDRLGCRACLTRPVAGPPPTVTDGSGPSGPALYGAVDPAADPVTGSSGLPRSVAPAALRRPAVDTDRARPHRPARSTGGRPQAQPPGERAASRADSQAVCAAGDKLAKSFWEGVASGDRRLRRLLLPGSPAGMLHELYGLDGPLHVVGMADGDLLESFTCRTEHVRDNRRPHLTSGWVVGQGQYPYGLRWEFVDRAARVVEVVPVLSPRGPHLPPQWGSQTWRAPTPRVALDPVANAVLSRHVPPLCLPLALRCLTAWARVVEEVGVGDSKVRAAALVRVVGWRAGRRDTVEALAARHGLDPDAVRDADEQMRNRLRISPSLGW
jgi:hypothetical protein